MIIGVDFDGTIVDHRFPDIGVEVPGAIKWLQKLKSKGCVLILITMRCDRPDGAYLSHAIDWCRRKGLEFDHVNENPGQKEWTSSPKTYANLYIDDAAVGCPLIPGLSEGGRPVVDWSLAGPMVLAYLEPHKDGHGLRA